jgi:hypothetical protein
MKEKSRNDVLMKNYVTKLREFTVTGVKISDTEIITAFFMEHAVDMISMCLSCLWSKV